MKTIIFPLLFVVATLMNCSTIAESYKSGLKEWNDKKQEIDTAQTDDAICSKIEKQKDDFTNEIKYHSPFATASGIQLNAIIFKTIKNGGDNYSLMLETDGSTLNYNEKGVIVLFSDGSKWVDSNSDISVEPNAASDISPWKYSAIMSLSENDINIFKSKSIDKFRLYIYDHEMDKFEAKKLRIRITCLTKP